MAFTRKLPDNNELLVRSRSGEWEVVERDYDGDFPETPRRSDGIGGVISKHGTKSEAVKSAINERTPHPFVIIQDSSGDVADVRWDQAFDSLRIYKDDDLWKLQAGSEFIHSAQTRGEVEDVGKEVQEDHGFRYLTIEKTDGSVYWKRQHPVWRKHS